MSNFLLFATLFCASFPLLLSPFTVFLHFAIFFDVILLFLIPFVHSFAHLFPSRLCVFLMFIFFFFFYKLIFSTLIFLFPSPSFIFRFFLPMFCLLSSMFPLPWFVIFSGLLSSYSLPPFLRLFFPPHSVLFLCSSSSRLSFSLSYSFSPPPSPIPLASFLSSSIYFLFPVSYGVICCAVRPVWCLPLGHLSAPRPCRWVTCGRDLSDMQTFLARTFWVGMADRRVDWGAGLLILWG